MRHKKTINPFPVYLSYGPRLLFMGADHQPMHCGFFSRKKRELKKALASIDHLAFEGTYRVRVLDSELQRQSCESFAFSRFRGRMHFLDQGADYPRILLDFGISPAAFRLFSIMRHMDSIMEGNAISKSLARSALEISSRLHPSAYSVDLDRMADSIQSGLIGPFRYGFPAHHMGVLEAVSKKFREFLNSVRDQRIYAPAIRSMLSELDGRIGIMIGAAHIPRICSIFDGNAPVPDWERHLGAMDDYLREGFEAALRFANKCQ